MSQTQVACFDDAHAQEVDSSDDEENDRQQLVSFVFAVWFWSVPDCPTGWGGGSSEDDSGLPPMDEARRRRCSVTTQVVLRKQTTNVAVKYIYIHWGAESSLLDFQNGTSPFPLESYVQHVDA